MYVPGFTRIDDLADVHEVMRAHPLAQFVTATTEGLLASPLPAIVAPGEGEFGTLYAHLARPNPQWSTPVLGEALAIFLAHDAYVSPSFYATKAETHKVVPTWNYENVHAYGAPEFFDDPARLLDVVTRLTERHEGGRASPWAVSDAPVDFISAMLKGIVGIRMPITRLLGKRKMSQNRNVADRRGVAEGLMADNKADVAALIPR
jgi:transcriptional regulator